MSWNTYIYIYIDSNNDKQVENIYQIHSTTFYYFHFVISGGKRNRHNEAN